MTPHVKRKPPELLKHLNQQKEKGDSIVRLVSRASHDWRLMRHVTLLEEDTHGWDCEWQGSAGVCPPPPVVTNIHFSFIGNERERERKKTSLQKEKEKKKKNQEVKRASDSCRKISHLDEGTSNCSSIPCDSLLLLTGDNCFEGPLCSPNLRYLASELNDPFKCYQSNGP